MFKKLNFMPAAGAALLTFLMLTSCDWLGDLFGNEKPAGPTGLYLGITGFNEELRVKEISTLEAGSRNSYHAFINNLKTSNGTILYYAVEDAIKQLKKAALPKDLTHVSIVTFTDGLDQGSLGKNNRHKTKEAYQDDLQKQIQTTKIRGKPITAYTVAIKGHDVTNDDEFEKNLRKLSSSAGNTFQSNTMSEVNANFFEIAKSLYNQTTIQYLKLQIPVQEDKAIIRFTFDNVNDAAKSNFYLQGSFNFSDKSLQNIEYKGFSGNGETKVKGEAEGIFVTYTFADLKPLSGTVVPLNYVKQWEYKTSLWQINSEFVPGRNTKLVEEWQSAAILLVLDCSTSLGNDFASLQSSAKEFINVLLDGVTQK